MNPKKLIEVFEFLISFKSSLENLNNCLMAISQKREWPRPFIDLETKKDRAIEFPTIRAFWKVCFSKSFVITHFKRWIDCRSRLKFYRSRNILFDLDFLISI